MGQAKVIFFTVCVYQIYFQFSIWAIFCAFITMMLLFFVSTAIQFVLSDEFSHLRPEQRLALLHVSKVPLYKNGLLVTS